MTERYYLPRAHPPEATGHVEALTADEEIESLSAELGAARLALEEAARLLGVAARTEELHRARIGELEMDLAAARRDLRRTQ